MAGRESDGERSKSPPKSLGALLAGSRQTAARLAGVSIDREQWRKLVGDRIASRTQPGRLRQGELTVFVASAAWAQELSMLTSEMLARLAGFGLKVDSIR